MSKHFDQSTNPFLLGGQPSPEVLRDDPLYETVQVSRDDDKTIVKFSLAAEVHIPMEVIRGVPKDTLPETLATILLERYELDLQEFALVMRQKLTDYFAEEN